MYHLLTFELATGVSSNRLPDRCGTITLVVISRLAAALRYSNGIRSAIDLTSTTLIT
jgi:hypothetical protein